MSGTHELRQLGWCESCGDPAYSSRWGERLVFKMIDGQLTYTGTEPIEHRICMRHKAKYMAHMEERKKELEKKTNGASKHKGCR